VRAPHEAARRGSLVVARLITRASLRSAAIYGLVVGGFIASSEFAYVASYKTAAERQAIELAFGHSAGVAALLGTAPDLRSVAGFTEWRCLGILELIGAIYSLLAATRLCRGEEEEGHTELLRAQAIGPGRLIGESLLGLCSSLGAGLVVATLIALVCGESSRVSIPAGRSILFTLTLYGAPVLFVALGVLTSQLGATRRAAAGIAGAMLAACFGLRMVGDSLHRLSFLRQLSPLGWLEQSQPLTSPRLWPLVAVLVLAVLLGGAAVLLGARRDLYASVLADRTTRHARPLGLSGPVAIAARLGALSTLGWCAMVATLSLVAAAISHDAGASIATTPAIAAALRRLGAEGLGAAGYLAVVQIVVVALLAYLGASQIASAREQERSGRLEVLAALPMSRASWLRRFFALGGATVLIAALCSGLASAAGGALGRSGIGSWHLVGDACYSAAPALFLLGIGTLALGAAPRHATALTYGLLAWSLLVEILGSVVHLSGLLLDTSLLHQLTAVPATAPDWGSAAVLVGTGALAALVGSLAFSRRDIAHG
jgi:ABC-2 type transport system permease protein